MRIYLYLLSGICSASIGWNIGQLFLSDVLSGQDFLYKNSEIILFPCVAIALAMGMVANEILMSNPTRWKLAVRKAVISVPIAFALGLLIGLGSGLLFQLLLIFSFPPLIARILGWLVIGVAVGSAEGITWRWRSIESGNLQRYHQRLRNSVLFAIAASVMAAIVFELARFNLSEMPQNFKQWEDFVGFCILGLLLGLAFSLSSSPSYLVALRAGKGFEWHGLEESVERETYPVIKTSHLQFVSTDVSDEEESEIEEGLSIQLPSQGKIIIGSSDNRAAAICLPGVEDNMGYITINGNKAYFKPSKQGFLNINIGGIDLTSSKETKELKHNTIITIKTSPAKPKLDQDPQELNDDETTTTNTTPEKTYEDSEIISQTKLYRFVYYNRFLDPQA